jgi:pilus assembly protein CpaF
VKEPFESFEPFYQLCRVVEQVFEEDWRDTDEAAKGRKLEREKRAIMGYEKETRFYKERIHDILLSRGYAHLSPPPWYRSLEEGIFHEVYGLAGLAPWAYDENEAYRASSSAKLIGDRLYCLIDGKSSLQPQRISEVRREQLKRALLLASPRERLEEGFHEVYLHNGIRITIFSGERTKAGQDVMVFRKYVLQALTFEKLAELGTIPEEGIPLFRQMIRMGFNTLFAGQVRSGKTTFLQVWQSQENPSLEGVAIATDPETPWHVLMPDAPIMQLVADGSQLEKMTKSLLRGDNDYVLLEEMRDATAYHLFLEITSMGTMRSKATIHDGSSVNIPYKMATAIEERYGGNLQSIISQIFRNINFVFVFCQRPENRAQKRLAGISAYQYDGETDQVAIYEICRYFPEEDSWRWKAAPLQREIMVPAGTGAVTEKEWSRMEELIKNLEYRNPIMGNSVIHPRYYRPQQEGRESRT